MHKRVCGAASVCVWILYVCVFFFHRILWLSRELGTTVRYDVVAGYKGGACISCLFNVAPEYEHLELSFTSMHRFWLAPCRFNWVCRTKCMPSVRVNNTLFTAKMSLTSSRSHNNGNMWKRGMQYFTIIKNTAYKPKKGLRQIHKISYCGNLY